MNAGRRLADGTVPTSASVVMEDVEQLVDGVLAELPALVRELCDRDGILKGLERLGALSVPLLRTLFEEDYAEVKAAIGSAAKVVFVARLKEAVLKASAPAAPATPAASHFQTPHTDAGVSGLHSDRMRALARHFSSEFAMPCASPSRAATPARLTPSLGQNAALAPSHKPFLMFCLCRCVGDTPRSRVNGSHGHNGQVQWNNYS